MLVWLLHWLLENCDCLFSLPLFALELLCLVTLVVCRCARVKEHPPAATHSHNSVLLKYSAQSSPPFVVALQLVLPRSSFVTSESSFACCALPRIPVFSICYQSCYPDSVPANPRHHRCLHVIHLPSTTALDQTIHTCFSLLHRLLISSQ